MNNAQVELGPYEVGGLKDDILAFSALGRHAGQTESARKRATL